MIHVAEGRTTSQISNGIWAQEDGADRSDMEISFRQRVRREEPLHCHVDGCRHSAFLYCCGLGHPDNLRILRLMQVDVPHVGT